MTEPLPISAGATLEETRRRSDELYRLHGDTVARICRALLRDRVEAEDAVQQVFLSAHGALLRGAVPREPAAWLATIARNECWARIRTRMSTPLASPVDDKDRLGPDPPTEAIRRAELRVFWQELAALPRAQRDAVVLREIRGLSYDQLAEQLAVSHQSVRSLLRRGRNRLRLRLADLHSGLGGFSWLDALARLVTGGGSAAAPVAAKVVALGVGAAALTGGAVVAPEVLEHHVHSTSAPTVVHRAAHHVAPVRPPRRAQRQAVSHVVRTQPADDRLSRQGRGRDDRVRAGEQHRSAGRDETIASVTDGGSHDAVSTSGTSSSGRDGGGSGETSSTTESSSGSGDGSTIVSSADSGSSGSGDGVTSGSGGGDVSFSGESDSSDGH